MSACFAKRALSGADDSIPVFSLKGYEGYAKITSVYDGDTFNAVIKLHGRVIKFKFRTLGYDAPEVVPRLNVYNRSDHIYNAKLARDMLKHECDFDDRVYYKRWNPFICNNKVNGMIWVVCDKNDKYGRTLVTVYKSKWAKKSVNDIMLESGIVNPYDGGKKVNS